jgi:hypothetical protein
MDICLSIESEPIKTLEGSVVVSKVPAGTRHPSRAILLTQEIGPRPKGYVSIWPLGAVDPFVQGQ